MTWWREHFTNGWISTYTKDDNCKTERNIKMFSRLGLKDSKEEKKIKQWRGLKRRTTWETFAHPWSFQFSVSMEIVAASKKAWGLILNTQLMMIEHVLKSKPFEEKQYWLTWSFANYLFLPHTPMSLSLNFYFASSNIVCASFAANFKPMRCLRYGLNINQRISIQNLYLSLQDLNKNSAKI